MSTNILKRLREAGHRGLLGHIRGETIFREQAGSPEPGLRNQLYAAAKSRLAKAQSPGLLPRGLLLNEAQHPLERCRFCIVPSFTRSSPDTKQKPARRLVVIKLLRKF